MNEQFTPAIHWALQASRLLAQEQSAAEVEPLHLLHGLLQEQEGKAFNSLLRAGLVQEELGRFIVAAKGNLTAEMPEISLSSATHSILRQARALCREMMQADPVHSEQLLFVLLRDAEEIRQSLVALGLNFAQFEKQIIEAMQGPPLELDEPLELAAAGDSFDTARIVDAAANRGREALRVIEDYCRFVLDDAFLNRELKTLRHDLAAALEQLPVSLLLGARETLRDVGTAITTAREQERTSALDVVQVNCKRLQEALRSLEEFGKVYDPNIGERIEQIRYRSYTLERMLLAGKTAREQLAGVRLYLLLTGSQCWGSLEWTVREAAAGGVQMFQLREKSLSDRELLERAKLVRRWTRETGTLFIMNDRPDIAQLADADGVHLGQEELPVREAHRILGANAIIGVSTHNMEQVEHAIRDGASYIGVGPTFPSQTKQFDEYPGLDFVRQAAALATLPAFVIGGVKLANLPQILDAGGRRIAVSGAICHSETPQALAQAMRQLLDARTEN